MEKVELLAPAGNLEKLKTAVYYGADAIYMGGKNYGLRSGTDNFDEKEMLEAVEFCHKKGVKIYITVNIFAHNDDFENLIEYLKFLDNIKVDGVLVSDIGILEFVKKYTHIPIHISTQANLTNKYSVEYFFNYGVKRVVLARELSIKEIKQIHEYVPKVDIEVFVHGAMCMAYSGRCLLSNYLTGRESNKGNCAQSCRWEYYLVEKKRDEFIKIIEDKRGTYFLNSRDLMMIEHLDKIIDAGAYSLKIEGRAKSPYYVAVITNAYRRALDYYYDCKKNNKKYICPKELLVDIQKCGNRMFTTGFYFDKNIDMQTYETNAPICDYIFIAVVQDVLPDGTIILEQRNRFKKGDKLNILSPNKLINNKDIIVEDFYDLEDNLINDALLVQQKIKIKLDLKFKKGDMLRKLVNKK